MPARLSTLKTRPEFLALNGGARAAKPGFVLLGRQRKADEDHVGAEVVRYGLTVTKRIGNAVARNRARRRLRALAQGHLAQSGVPGWDYVLIARDEALSRSYMKLEGDLESALEMLHKARRTQGSKAQGSDGSSAPARPAS